MPSVMRAGDAWVSKVTVLGATVAVGWVDVGADVGPADRGAEGADVGRVRGQGHQVGPAGLVGADVGVGPRVEAQSTAPRGTALVGRGCAADRRGNARVDGRAAGQQGHRLGRPAVVLPSGPAWGVHVVRTSPASCRGFGSGCSCRSRTVYVDEEISAPVAAGHDGIVQRPSVIVDTAAQEAAAWAELPERCCS